MHWWTLFLSSSTLNPVSCGRILWTWTLRWIPRSTSMKPMLAKLVNLMVTKNLVWNPKTVRSPSHRPLDRPWWGSTSIRVTGQIFGWLGHYWWLVHLEKQSLQQKGCHARYVLNDNHLDPGCQLLYLHHDRSGNKHTSIWWFWMTPSKDLILWLTSLTAWVAFKLLESWKTRARQRSSSFWWCIGFHWWALHTPWLLTKVANSFPPSSAIGVTQGAFICFMQVLERHGKMVLQSEVELHFALWFPLSARHMPWPQMMKCSRQWPRQLAPTTMTSMKVASHLSSWWRGRTADLLATSLVDFMDIWLNTHWLNQSHQWQSKQPSGRQQELLWFGYDSASLQQSLETSRIGPFKVHYCDILALSRWFGFLLASPEIQVTQGWWHWLTLS